MNTNTLEYASFQRPLLYEDYQVESLSIQLRKQCSESLTEILDTGKLDPLRFLVDYGRLLRMNDKCKSEPGTQQALVRAEKRFKEFTKNDFDAALSGFNRNEWINNANTLADQWMEELIEAEEASERATVLFDALDGIGLALTLANNSSLGPDYGDEYRDGINACLHWMNSDDLLFSLAAEWILAMTSMFDDEATYAYADWDITLLPFLIQLDKLQDEYEKNNWVWNFSPEAEETSPQTPPEWFNQLRKHAWRQPVAPMAAAAATESARREPPLPRQVKWISPDGAFEVIGTFMVNKEGGENILRIRFPQNFTGALRLFGRDFSESFEMSQKEIDDAIKQCDCLFDVYDCNKNEKWSIQQ